MASPVEQTANASYFKGSTTQVTCCDQTETDFHLYLHQIGQGPDANQIIVNTLSGFGMMVVTDWAIREGLDPASKLVALAKGHLANCRENNWCTLFNMVFKDDSFKGSTLEVRGAWDPAAPFEWAILGGTGLFTLAQGVISGNRVRAAPTTNIMELNIRVFYRTLAKPAN